MTDKQKIKDLERQLQVAKKHTYVYETTSLHCNDGEFYMYYGDDKCVVFNVEQLFKDFRIIVKEFLMNFLAVWKILTGKVEDTART